MDNTYTTISGQTWDQIAYEVYGNEYHCDKLMDANRDKLEYFVFPDGIILKIPSLETIASFTIVTNDYPAWRSRLNAR